MVLPLFTMILIIIDLLFSVVKQLTSFFSAAGNCGSIDMMRCLDPLIPRSIVWLHYGAADFHRLMSM
jgi:hypothetical protein